MLLGFSAVDFECILRFVVRQVSEFEAIWAVDSHDILPAWRMPKKLNV